MKFMVLLSVLVLALSGCSHYGKKGHHHKGGHHHKMWKKMDADGNNEVTKAEFDKAHNEMFKKMDANGDGKITKEEKMAWKKSKKKCCKGDKKNKKGKKKECCK